MLRLKRLTVPALKRLRDVDLWLPRRGATLIEGPNESGKSTLFEAIYFALYGRPLIGEEPGRATLSALIPHDGAQAQARLILLTGETELEVTRTLSRTRSGGPTSEATLIVRQPGRAEERISAVSAVNDRILAELRGLDGDTLRNSCFMEQKGLERLESRRRDEREEAISRLLGLQRLVSAERELAPTADDRRQIAHLRAQVRLAQERRRLHEAAAREVDVSQRLHAAELREVLEQRDTFVARMANLEESARRVASEREEIEQRLARIDALRAIARRLAEADRLRWSARQAAHETTLLTAQLEQLSAVEGAHGPEAQRRLDDLRRLETRLREVSGTRAQLEEALELARRVQAAELAQTQARATLAETERARSGAVLALSRAQGRDTLIEWIKARERADVREGRTQQLAALNLEREGYEHQVAETRTQGWQWLALTGASAAMALISLALTLALSLPALWVIVALSGVAAVLLAFRWRQEVIARRARAWKLAQTDQGITTLRAEVNLAQRLVNDDIARIESNLRATGMPIPESAEAGERILRGLSSANNLTLAEGQARDFETRAARARIELERAVDDGAAAALALRNLGFEAQPEQIEQIEQIKQIEYAAANAEAEQAALVAEARSLGLPEDLASLTASRGAAELALGSVSASAGASDETRARLIESSESLEETLRKWASELQSAAIDLVAQQVTTTTDIPATPGLPVLESLHDRLANQAQVALEQCEEDATRSRQGVLIAERERLAAKTEETREGHTWTLEQARARLVAVGISAQGDESLTTLTQAWPLLGDVSAAEAPQLRAEREGARMETYHTEQTAAERERETALASGPLDEQSLQARLAAAEREVRRRQLASDLAVEARSRIIRRALPETEVYMRAILPELTAGRYHDIALLRDDSSNAGGEIDLAIRMWDQLAGRYVRKNLFSGGARDQASLALRLAFALATLPKELGATPGFIFLDEPRSAFDAERSLALARILTTGAIAQAFAQIFLISHSQVIEPTAFDYSLRMDDGHVAESTLPSGELAE